MLGGSRSSTPNTGVSQPFRFDYGHQPSLSELEVPDFLGDLTSLESSMKENFQRIGFIQEVDEEEPFQFLV